MPRTHPHIMTFSDFFNTLTVDDMRAPSPTVVVASVAGEASGRCRARDRRPRRRAACRWRSMLAARLWRRRQATCGADGGGACRWRVRRLALPRRVQRSLGAPRAVSHPFLAVPRSPPFPPGFPLYAHPVGDWGISLPSPHQRHD
jgi:hypothetical protein